MAKIRNPKLQSLMDEIPLETKIFVRNYSELVVRIHRLLEKKGWTQAELASSMDKRPSEISKWLNGSHNFTLKSLAKLEAELGEVLIQIPSPDSMVMSRHRSVSGKIARPKKMKSDGFTPLLTVVHSTRNSLSQAS